MTNGEILRPCPFCGCTRAQLVRSFIDGDSNIVHCPQCDACGPRALSTEPEGTAAARWNAASPDEPSEKGPHINGQHPCAHPGCPAIIGKAVYCSDHEPTAHPWDKLLADCMAQPCEYPCLRDDLGDWMRDNGLKWPDEQP